VKNFNLGPEDRSVVKPAREAAEKGVHDREKGNEGIYCGAALQLKDGTLITGCNSPFMHAASSLVLKAVKHLAGIPPKLDLLPPVITETVRNFKTEILNEKSVSLDLEETLIALSISATANPAAGLAVEKIKELRGCEVHITHIPTPGDEAGMRKLGLNVTSDPIFATKDLYIS